MYRGFGRVFRGTCRKWRENEVPTVGGEEVRRNQDKKEKFVPPTRGTSCVCLSYLFLFKMIFSNYKTFLLYS